MLDHVGLEVSDLARAARFYDAVLFALGGRRLVSSEQAVAYGQGAPQLWIVARGRALAPLLRGRADPGLHHGHCALRASGRAAVEGAHAAGVAHGGTDDGAPGPRPLYGPGTYSAYLRDPDGLRLEIVSRA